MSKRDDDLYENSKMYRAGKDMQSCGCSIILMLLCLPLILMAIALLQSGC